MSLLPLLAQEASRYSDTTTIHYLAVAMLFVMAVLTLSLRRELALLPLILMLCFVSPAQRITVMGLDLTLLRLLLVIGWLRVLVVHRDRDPFVWRAQDYLVLAYTIVASLAHIVRIGDVGGVVFRAGYAVDTAGVYFLCRRLIRNWRDVVGLVRGFGVVSLPVAAFFVVEAATGRNLFSVFGGVPEVTDVRDGRLRCQGAFAHPILAGCFWASLLPLFWGYWVTERARVGWKPMLWIGCALLVVVLCASSTPVLAVGAVLLGAAVFPLRRSLSAIRWAIAAVLLVMHVSMRQPVWHLISRIDVVGGSTGWHRFFLVDEAIKHLPEWWLLGESDTTKWAPTLGDVTSQYVLEGVRGGVFGLGLFAATMVVAFRNAGRIGCWGLPRANLQRQQLAWALGVSLFAHAMCFIAVAYFGQIVQLWYLLLALVECVAEIGAARPAASGAAAHHATEVARRGASASFVAPR